MPAQAAETTAAATEDRHLFLVQFELGDLKNPKNFSATYKAWVVLQMSLLAMAGSLGSSITSPAQGTIEKDMNASSNTTSLAVALFVLGWAFGPMIWAPVSEVYGRRMGMLPAMCILGLFSIGMATRILTGVSCALCTNVANQFFYKKTLEVNNGNVVPEARLPPIMVGGLLFSGGLFWFGWTAAPKYPWILPVLAAGFIGAGFNVIFQQCLNFLADAYGPFAASAVSANTVLRSVLVCAMPIAAQPMFEGLGVALASSLLGGISCLALPLPLLFMKYGPALRQKSKFAPMTRH